MALPRSDRKRVFVPPVAPEALVVSWVDNLIRPLVISGPTRIPFLLVFLGVLGGINAFGLIGLFLGPVLLAVSVAIWREWQVHAQSS